MEIDRGRPSWNIWNRNSTLQAVMLVCFVAALSYFSPKLEAALMLHPKTVWPLWPGSALLVPVLLVVPRRIWLILITVACASFALYGLQAGVPLRSFAWFIPADAVQILIATLCLSYFFHGVPRLNSVEALAKYLFSAVILAPFTSALISAPGIGVSYWSGWKISFFSEALAFLTLTPAILVWVSGGRTWLQKRRTYQLEAVGIMTGLTILGYVYFTSPVASNSPALLFSLVPFLLWSALRFASMGTSSAVIIIVFLSIWGAVHGRGPFVEQGPVRNVFSLQVFLISTALPFMVLAALVEERQIGEAVLRESEERFRRVSNTAPVMIWMADTDKLCIYFNEPWLEFTGRSFQDELGNGWAQGVHPDDLQKCLEIFTQSFDRRESFRIEYRLRRHDGEYRWVLDSGVPRFNADASFAGYIGSCVDVTERRQAEGILSNLSRKLIEAQENERSRIARDLHDDIGQRLSILAIKIEQTNLNPTKSPSIVKTNLEEIREDCYEITTLVHALSHQLHSSTLDHLGIVAALRATCAESLQQHGVSVYFSDRDVPKHLAKDVSLCLFRVAQEAVHNAIKYSGVDEFSVEIIGTENEIQLVVQDSGTGFDMEEVRKNPGLGLISMQERLHLVEGTLSIESKPGQGTTIVAVVPLSLESGDNETSKLTRVV